MKNIVIVGAGGVGRETSLIIQQINELKITWNLIGFIIMLFLRRTKKLKVGYLTGFYLIWYSIGRCFIEYFRSDSLMLGNIKVAQLISLSLIVIGIIVIIKSTKKNELYN